MLYRADKNWIYFVEAVTNALYLILKRVFFTHVVSQTFHKPKDVVCYFISAYISKSPDKTSCTGACSFVSKNSVYF